MPLKANVLWKEQLTDKPDTAPSIFSIAYHPDGSQLLVAVGTSIQVFDSKTGTLLNRLNAHKGNVHCIAYAHDGTYFASGSTDKSVIIWSNQLEGKLKYSHSEAIQCLAYNPVSHQILSCATTEIGLWSPEHRQVAKRKVTSRVCSCSWTSDGQFYALGQYNGTVSIWTKNGDEKIKIDRPSGSPVWCLAWNSSRGENDVLSVCDWGQTLSFYSLNGKQIGRDHFLDFDPCCFSYSSDGDFYLIGGSSKIACLYSKEGVKLGTVGDAHNSWIWSCQCRPGGKEMVVACNDGTIVCYDVTLVTVHGLYKDRYAYRHGLTDVIVQHLLTEEKVHLKCRDIVKKIALYKNRLAVQLSEKLIIYELSTDEESGDMTYIVKERIARSLQCSLLVCCSEHVVFCSDRKLLSLTLKGEIEREWEVDSQIRYLKVLGGSPGKEAMLAGLKNGQILKFFLTNPFPVSIYTIPGTVRCVDLSPNHTKLAIVDENNLLTVYNLKKKEIVYQEPNATSVAWNTSIEGMLCYSGNGVLNVKTENYPPHQQPLQTGHGFVVGFIGSKIFSLHYFNMTTTEIPQSTPMRQYLEQGLYSEAYKVACLGVSQNDWKTLGLSALEGMNFEIAKKSFARTHDIKYLELIHDMEERVSKNEDRLSFVGDIMAYEGKFKEAAKAYVKANCNEKAVSMYVDLCQFELAKKFMKGGQREEKKVKVQGEEDKKEETKSIVTERDLQVKEADWARSTNDTSKACEMYLTTGEYMKAISIMTENRWTHKLVELANELPKSQVEALKTCAQQLKKLGEFNFAADVFDKLEDYSSLISLYADTQQWQKGFELVEQYPQLKELVYLPYTTYLMENDQFEAAQEALVKAEKQNEAVNLLAKLTESTLNMRRYKDAGYYHWLQARAYLEQSKQLEKGSSEMKQHVRMFHKHVKISEIYYVYQHIHSFVNLPFTGQLAETMFNMASFVAHHLGSDIPPGVSKVSTYLTLGKHGTAIGAYKTARFAFEKLQSLLVPSELQDYIDTAVLTLRGKPLQDKEELLRFCYRCSSSNPPVNSSGDYCSTCGHPFLYSFASFEVLPVVQFFLEDDISDEEALSLIKSEPQQGGDSKQQETDVLIMDGPSDTDPFVQRLLVTDDNGHYGPVTVDRSLLINMHWSSVIIKKWPYPLETQYYSLLIPNVQIRLCSNCNQMFYSDDYELHVLCNGHCPFCRQPQQQNH